MPDSYFPFYSAIGVMFCIAIVILLWTSLKDRNEFVERRSGTILVYALTILLLPSIILLTLQVLIVNPFLESTIERKTAFIQKNRYLDSIVLEWDGKLITEKSKLKDIEQTILHRLRDNRQISSVISDTSPTSDLYTTKIVLSPHAIPVNDPGSNDEVRDIIKAIQRPDSKEGNDILSIRTVFAGDAGSTPPEGFHKLPWKDSYVYVADTTHISDGDILSAKPYGKNTLLVTLTDPGQLRMNAMARYTDASKSRVALIHHGKIVGIYEPEMAMTDQFVISPIQGGLTTEQAADELTLPRIGDPSNKVLFDYTTIQPEGFRFKAANWLIGIPPIVSTYLWLALMGIMLIVTCTALFLLHKKTRTPQNDSF